MDVKFAPVITNAISFPDAVFRSTPGLGFKDITKLWQSEQLNQCTYTRNGITAIGIAAKHLQLERTNLVLLPAYHCPTLVAPFLWLDYQVRFYPVQTDLSLYLAVFSDLPTTDKMHCMLVRFLGLKPNVDQLITSANAAGKIAIVDCSIGLVDFVRMAELTYKMSVVNSSTKYSEANS